MIKNIISNFIGKIINGLSIFIFIPFYIKLLGVDAFGIISFYSVLLGMLFFADAGLSVTLNREIARAKTETYKINLVFSVERIFTFIFVAIVIGIGISSVFFAKNWLNSEVYLFQEKALYIIMMGVCVGLQLFITIENSGLLGLEKQVEANIIQSSGALLKSGGVIFLLYFSPNLITFFLWQIGVMTAIFFTTRKRLWSHLKIISKPKFDLEIFNDIKSFALALMALSLLNAVNTQIDKLAISRLLSLTEFAIYSLGSTISQVSAMVVSPIAVAFMPRMVRLVETKQTNIKYKTYKIQCFLISSLSSLVGIVLIFNLEHVLTIWISDKEVINKILPFGKILVLANMLLSLQIAPFNLGIAHGHTKTILKISLVLLVFFAPTYIFCVIHFGLTGASWAWLAYNFIFLVSLTYFIHNLFLKEKKLMSWIFTTIAPIIICIIIGTILHYIFGTSDYVHIDLILILSHVLIYTLIIAVTLKKLVLGSGLNLFTLHKFR